MQKIELTLPKHDKNPFIVGWEGPEGPVGEGDTGFRAYETTGREGLGFRPRQWQLAMVSCLIAAAFVNVIQQTAHLC